MADEKKPTPSDHVPTWENPHGPPMRHPGGGPIPVGEQPNAQLDGDDVVEVVKPIVPRPR